MNKDRAVITGIVSVLIFAVLLATGATDAVFIIYAMWCEKI
jgi:hypothetical protein